MYAPALRPIASSGSRSAASDAARLVYPDRRWERAWLGLDSHYLWTMSDDGGALLDGSRRYSLELPAGIPVKTFCSVAVCESHGGRLQRNEHRVFTTQGEHAPEAANDEISPLIRVTFAPRRPRGGDAYWISTACMGSWFALLRFCGPLHDWFEHAWRPGDVVLESFPCQGE